MPCVIELVLGLVGPVSIFCDLVKSRLEDSSNHKLNKLWSFTTASCTLHVPALCVAVCHRSLALIQCLLSHGADPNRVGRMCVVSSGTGGSRTTRISPWLMALEDHPSQGLPFHPGVASALLAAGADINTTVASRVLEEEEEGGTMEYISGNTPLHNCVSIALSPSLSVFSFLLDNGADMFIRDASGRTPLQKVLESLNDHPDQEMCLCSVAEELIRRGGFVKSSSNSDQSDFILVLTSIAKMVVRNLPVDRQLRRAHLLLDAGYQCSQADVARFELLHIHAVDSFLNMRVHGLCVCELKHLCRLKIRELVGQSCEMTEQQTEQSEQQTKLTCSPARLSQLPLPRFLIHYVSLMS